MRGKIHEHLRLFDKILVVLLHSLKIEPVSCIPSLTPSTIHAMIVVVLYNWLWLARRKWFYKRRIVKFISRVSTTISVANFYKSNNPLSRTSTSIETLNGIPLRKYIFNLRAFQVGNACDAISTNLNLPSVT